MRVPKSARGDTRRDGVGEVRCLGDALSIVGCVGRGELDDDVFG